MYRVVVGALLCVLFCNHLGDSSRILMVPYSGEGSHYLSMAHVGEVLVEHGHQVTLLISDIFAYHAPKHEDVFSYEFFPHHLGSDGWRERKIFQNNGLLSGEFAYKAIVLFEDLVRNFSKDCEDIMRDPALRDRLVKAEYDFVLADAITPCGVIVAHMLHVPHGLFLPISAFTTLTRFVSAPGEPSHTPAWQSGLSHRMSFPERTLSSLIDIGWSLFFNVFVNYVHEELRPKYDIRTDTTSREGMAEAHFFLSFTDWTLAYPQAFTPNMIGSAGLNIDTTKATLTEEWINFMETTGSSGVIVMSFGTIVRSLPQPITGKFIDALSKLPYTVLWHMPNETDIGRALPANIQRHEWLPLLGILAHKNTILFISHAGINSVFEAIHYSKPILSVPIFGDQPDIARRLVDKGVALYIDIYKSTSEDITHAVQRLATEKSFRENLHRVTSLYQHSIYKPREILPYVIEQTMRSRSLYLQRCKGQTMGFIQYYLLDVISVCAALAFIVSVLMYKIFRVLKKTLALLRLTE